MKTTKYAEPTMKLALLKTNGTAASDLEEVEGTADVRFLPLGQPALSRTRPPAAPTLATHCDSDSEPAHRR